MEKQFAVEAVESLVPWIFGLGTFVFFRARTTALDGVRMALSTLRIASKKVVFGRSLRRPDSIFRIGDLRDMIFFCVALREMEVEACQKVYREVCLLLLVCRVLSIEGLQ